MTAEHRDELVRQLVADIEDEDVKAQCQLDVLRRLDRAIAEAQQNVAARTQIDEAIMNVNAQKRARDPHMIAIDEALDRAKNKFVPARARGRCW